MVTVARFDDTGRPVILVLRRMIWEDLEFEGSLGYMERCLNKQSKLGYMRGLIIGSTYKICHYPKR